MCDPSDHKHLRRNHGFARRVRHLVRTTALPWQAKAEVYSALARLGPDAAWDVYKRYVMEKDYESGRMAG